MEVRETERTHTTRCLTYWARKKVELKITEITRLAVIRTQVHVMGKWGHSYTDGKRNWHNIFGGCLAINVSKWKSHACFD